MKLNIHFSAKSIRLSALMLVMAWLIVGCSDSSKPAAGETPPSIDSTGSDDSTGSETNDNNVPDEALDTTDDVSDDDTTGDEVIPEGVDDVVNGNPVVEDPLVQNRVVVTFEMTVPFYLSNELSVELVWGDVNLTAMWVGGQFWSASGEFPTETEHPLVITFYDNNGFVELARYSQNYRTTSNVTEAVQIQAEQFDATQFDYDEDGTNNLDELNAGTDIYVDEDSLLEIQDFYAISDPFGIFSRMSVSESFESRLTEARPYVATIDSDPDSVGGAPVSGNINIDIDGNGTLDVNPDAAPTRPLLTLTGTRAHSESSISWTGIRRELDSDYFHMETVTNSVSVVDENSRELMEEVTGRNNGTYEYTWETSANLTGNLIEGTSLCKPVAGTFTATHRTADPDISVVVTTVSKEIDDRYWKVVVVDDDANNVGENESQTREYFVRELRMLQRTNAPDSAYFICDFVDI